MKTQVTLTGLVATTPRTSPNRLTFRLVTDEGDGTSWFTIYCYGQLAENVLLSIDKGNRVILTGDLAITDFDNGEITGTTAEVVATAIGYNLAYGTSENTRVFPNTATEYLQKEYGETN